MLEPGLLMIARPLGCQHSFSLKAAVAGHCNHDKECFP